MLDRAKVMIELRAGFLAIRHRDAAAQTDLSLALSLDKERESEPQRVRQVYSMKSLNTQSLEMTITALDI